MLHGEHERIEDGFKELVLPLLNHMGSGDQTLVIKLDNNHLYPLSNFTAPVLYFLSIKDKNGMESFYSRHVF